MIDHTEAGDTHRHASVLVAGREDWLAAGRLVEGERLAARTDSGAVVVECIDRLPGVLRVYRPRLQPDQEFSGRSSTASAASFNTSANVGCAWLLRAMSSLLAPNSMATAASAIRSPARGPMM